MRLRLILTTLVAGITAALAFAGAPSSAQAEGAEAPGKALVTERCSVCHTTTVIDDKRATEADWQETVGRMVSYGAQVNDAEAASIVKYLSATHNTAAK